MKKSAFIIILIILIAIVGIGWVVFSNNVEAPSTTSTDSSTKSKDYTNSEYGFKVNYQSTLEATTTFTSSYLVGSDWSLYSDTTKNTGTPVISFRKIGSNDVTNAELRIGVSRDQADVDACTTVQEGITAKMVTINGIDFTSFNESNAAMMHFSDATSYRTLHNGLCFAIDLFVTGTNPAVYDPPKTVPFDQNKALEELTQALNTFTFLK